MLVIEILFLREYRIGSKSRNEITQLKEIKITSIKEVLSFNARSVIKNEKLKSEVFFPEQIRIIASMKIFNVMKRNIAINGYNSTSFNGTSICMIISHERIVELTTVTHNFASGKNNECSESQMIVEVFNPIP